MNLKKRLLMLIVIACTFLPAMAVAETTECTVIDSIPYVITQQGVYCLKGNLASSATTGNAIDIQTNNVTIDFNGFKLGNLGGGTSTQMNGVYSNERSNIIVKNGVIRGFYAGVIISGGTGHQILNNIFDGNFKAGVFIWNAEAAIDGNTIINTGGRPDEDIYGINLNGASYSYVTNNKISGVSSLDPENYGSYGIIAFESNDIIIRGNTLLKPATNGSKGIFLMDADGAILDSNIVSKHYSGIEFYSQTDLTLTYVLSNNNSVLSTNNYWKGNSTTLIDAGGNYPAIPAP